MKKKIMILAVAVASMAGFSSYAQQLSATATSGVKNEKCVNQSCSECNAFEGITLTSEQQKKFDALNANCKANKEKNVADKKAAKEQARANRKQAKRDYLKQVKGILTPEQYVVYLENIVVSDAPKGHGNRPGGKDMKRGAGQKTSKTTAVAQ